MEENIPATTICSDMTPTIGKLAEALSKAQSMLTGSKEDASNPFFKSTYSTLTAVWAACRKPLSDNGLSIIQLCQSEIDMVVVETMLCHSSGEWIKGKLAMKPVKNDPQGIGSCITYARRYSLAAIVGISPEDDDGEASMDRKTALQVKKPTSKNLTKSIPPAGISDFDRLISTKTNLNPGLPNIELDKFVGLIAEAQGITIDELKCEAAKEFNSFWAAFETWRKKEHPSIEAMKKAIEEITTLPHLKNWRTKHKDEVNSLPAKLKSEISTIWTKRETELKEAYKKEQEDKQENKEEQPSVMVKCPNRNYEKISVEVCGNCKNVSGCPSYEDATLNLKG